MKSILSTVTTDVRPELRETSPTAGSLQAGGHKAMNDPIPLMKGGKRQVTNAALGQSPCHDVMNKQPINPTHKGKTMKTQHSPVLNHDLFDQDPNNESMTSFKGKFSTVTSPPRQALTSNVDNILFDPHPPGDTTQACLHCGKEFTVPAGKKKGRKKKYCSHSCAVKYYGKHIGDRALRSQQITTYYQLHPARRFLASTKRSAKLRGMIFDLTEQWFKERLERGKCEATGLPIKCKVYKKQDTGRRFYYSPSVDRIDNNIGYIPSNCRLVTWGYNIGKHTYTDRDLMAMSLALVLQSTHPSMHAQLLSLLPKTVVAALPSDHGLF